MGGDPTNTGYPVALRQSGAVRSGTGAPALALLAHGPGYARRVRKVIECFRSRARRTPGTIEGTPARAPQSLSAAKGGGGRPPRK
jgi:hypothetical protein